MAGIDAASKLVHAFIERSIHAVYKRVLDILDAKSKKEAKHPLAVLANNLKLIAEDESLAFIPVSCQLYPEAGMLSSPLLHQLYGEQLEPFLEGVGKSVLSETVRSVLAASDSLERSLAGNFNSLMEESEKSLCQFTSISVNRNILYPNPPALTRYKELTNPFIKKKPGERIVMEEKVINQLNDLTTSKLCVKLNTLHYIRYQLDMLEDSIKQSWMLAQPDYEAVPAKEYTSESPFLSDILKKGTSFNWSEKGQRSFRVMMKKFQEATSEIRQALP